MGCCSSKDKDKVTEPQKKLDLDPIEVDKDARKNVEIRSNLEGSPLKKSRQQIEFEEAEAERERKRAIERAEEKRRGMKKPTARITKDKHAKLLSLIDDKYKNLQSLLIILGETLRSTERDDETIDSLMQNIRKDANDIENSLEDLQAFPFPNDKEYLKNLRKIIEVVRELDLDYLSFKKKATKYPEYKKNVTFLLHREYPDLFTDFKEQESPKQLEPSMSPNSELRFPGSDIKSSPRNQVLVKTPSPIRQRPITEDEIVIMQLREADNVPQKRTVYDDAFDREMVGVMHQQKNEAVFELDTAVNDYNRLLQEFNKIKQKQDYIQRDYQVVDQEAKELRDINNQIAYLNDAVRVENGTFMNVQTEITRNHEQVARSCLALEGELMELRRQVQQRESENQRADQDYEAKIRQLEQETRQKQQEAKELERRYQEDMKKLFAKNDEVQHQRTNMYEEVNRQLGADGVANLPSMEPQFHYSPPTKFSPPRYYDSIVAPRYSGNPMKSSFTPFEFPRKSLLAQDTVMVNGERRSIHDNELKRPEDFPRRSVSPRLSEEILRKRMAEEQMENRNFVGVSSALDYARKARMGADRNNIAGSMDRMRAELQQIPLSGAENGRMSTLGTAPKGSPYRERLSQGSSMVRSGDRNSAYMLV